ncbi:FtsX-like permease family protein [Runella sp. CRIBMP]|uniref:ABC transporter permease n=1 Tax=Runella sp. CRIBMP TaxID=2683261 RepID=UPI0014134AEC|nr:ABC transporter permease [Runella sp. CRIBMP]NBB19886.1 FtsX-like permease family protein [Runella sp. CRIBMP]
MLQNYFKIGWRNLRKNGIFTFINIFGLSVGLTFTLLIGSYVWNEWQVNADLRNIENQYIIQSKWKQPNMGIEITSLAPLAKTLKEQYPNLIENYYRFDGVSTTVSKGDKHFREDIQIGDSTLLTMYGIPLMHGDARTALNQPNSVVLSEKMALKYFGKTDIVGQTIQIESFTRERKNFMVTAVLAPISFNSITHYVSTEIPVLLPMSSLAFFGRDAAMTVWDNAYVVNYIELKKGIRPVDLQKPIRQLISTHASAQIRDNLEVMLKPLSTLHRENNNGLINKTLLTLSLVALFIVFMAVVNFVNISIGSSSGRLKEIGIRKVLGSKKGQMIGQFLTESILIASFSTLFSLVLYEVSRTYFAEILGKELRSIFSALPFFVVSAAFLGVLVGLVAGAYPAFVLSALPSIDSMKGKLKTVNQKSSLRYSLMTGQFAIALFVFGAAVVIARQVNYFFEKDLGYSKESIVWAPVPRDWSVKGVEKMETIRKEMTRLPDVREVSLSFEIPNGKTGFQTGLFRAGQDSTQAIFVPVLQTDEHYARTYQIPVRNGVFFQKAPQAVAPNLIVLNAKAAKMLNFATAAAAIGQQVRLQSFPQTFTVAGVTDDFHFDSMRQSIGPLAFIHLNTLNNYRFLSFKIQSTSLNKSVAALEKKWNELLPGAPFEFTFLDEMLQNLYQSEVRLKKAAQLATVLAMIIVLLGVIGMVSLSVARRTKELGIRKVLGASGAGLVLLFLKEFLIVIGIAAFISFPLLQMAMNQWLQNYAYRIEVSWLSFAAVVLSFGIMIVCLVGFQTFKAALMNPTQSLRSE